MKLPASAAALTLSLALAAPVQVTAQTAPRFTDPANLRGERVTPHTGRELPIDQAEAQGGHGLQQLLRKLSTRASILNIVAHPDDEDGGMLTLYARGLGARVADLSLTRGEGGQNAMTGDFEDALGLLRTQELLSNDRYTGVDQMFGTEVDFGFSKTKREAFTKWTHDRVLYDAVRAIRLYRPLVITATFIGGVTDGHGQHQVSGQIAQEAFLAAGDPKVFPDMIAEGILPWQPLKMYARVPSFAITDKGLFDYATGQYVPPSFTNYVSGVTSTTPPTPDVVVHEGIPDPLLTTASANRSDLPPTLASQTTPFSYVQFARVGLGLQKSQIGPGVRNAPGGTFDAAFHLYGSCLPGSPTSRLCHLNAAYSSGVNHTLQTATPLEANGAPHASLGRSPKRTPSEATGGLKAHPVDDPIEPSFFTGIDTSIGGIATLAPYAGGNISVVLKTNLAGIQNSIVEAQTDFKTNHPEFAAPHLSEALTLTDAAIKHVSGFSSNQLPVKQKEDLLHELRVKRVQINDALVLALDLQLHAKLKSPETSRVAPSEMLPVEVNVTTTSEETIRYLTPSEDPIPLDRSRAWGTGVPLSPDHPVKQDIAVNGKGTYQRPYFSRPNIEQPFYDIDGWRPDLRNAPASPPVVSVYAYLSYRNAVLTMATSPTQDLVPPLSVAIQPHAQVVPETEGSITLKASVRVMPVGRTSLSLSLETPAGWRPDTRSVPITPSSTGSYSDFDHAFILTAQVPLSPAQSYRVKTHAQSQDANGNMQSFDEGFRAVGYPGIPYTNLYTPATNRIVPVDLRLPIHDRIAYLPGTGDAVADNLRSIGFTVTNLTVADLAPAKLAQFDTIILGVRTYNAHPDLHGAPTQALLDFARAGGNLIVQYQTPEFTAADAPYPLSLGSNEKVVDETSPVRLLDPAHPALNTPNHITPNDFNGWIEERGHGFLSTWDPHYTALIETHDPGAPAEHVQPQAPQEGGLITTQLGRGHWTYVAFALYRQLPEAVPGAFRLFTNLLALTSVKP